jgi:hypothetical protein
MLRKAAGLHSVIVVRVLGRASITDAGGVECGRPTS